MVQVTTPPVVTAQHGTGNPPIRFGNQTEARVASQKRGDGGARVGFVQSHAFGAPPQCDDRVVIFDPEMAHDCSIVAGAAGRHLFHGTLTFLAGLRGMSCVERKRIVMSFTIQTGFISF
jgi:hypothetical protein